VQYVAADTPAPQNEPAGQIDVGLAAYTDPLGQKKPAAHGPLTAESAALTQYDAAGHTMGAERPAVQYAPAGHWCCAALGDETPPGQKKRARHAPCDTVRPVTAQYEPRAHGVGTDRPVSAQNEPGWHTVGAALADGQ
jgi:hypothetical protein